MRKLIVGLIAVAVLATAAPAMAQFNDPLSLIASGAVIPFVGTGGAISGNNVALSFIEVSSPVGDNSNFHMFFFDSNCTRAGDSVGLPVTENGVAVLRVDNIQPTDKNPSEGLIAAAGVDATGFALQPLNFPIHLRMLWFDVTAGFARTLEPIALDGGEFSAFDNNAPRFSITTWDPLRSGATFFTPLVTSPTGFDTTIFFICPNTAVSNDINSAAVGAFPITKFPALLDANGHPPQTSGAQTATSLRVRVFDAHEVFLRDLRTTCGCLTARPLIASPAQGGISDVFHDAVAADSGTFSEVEGDTVAAKAAVCDFTTQTGTAATNPGAPAPDCSVFTGQAAGPLGACNQTTCNTFTTFKVVTPSQQAAGPAVFTGYRAMPVHFGPVNVDLFGRLSNSSFSALRGVPLGIR
jgi:hypothetical protein